MNTHRYACINNKDDKIEQEEKDQEFHLNNIICEK